MPKHGQDVTKVDQPSPPLDPPVDLEWLEYHCEDCRAVSWSMKRIAKLTNRLLVLQHEITLVHKVITGHTHGAMLAGVSKRWAYILGGGLGFLAAATLAIALAVASYWPESKQTIVSMMGSLFH